VWPKRQDWTRCLTENLFCARAEKQLGYAMPSVRADDEEICVLLSHDLSQFRPQFTLPNDEFVLNASESAGLNQRVLQIRGLARYCLFTGSNRGRSCHG
jgi:hypothetical protein